jgi:lysophospholipase L1-like esterase
MWGDSLTGNIRGIIPNNGHTVVTQAFLDKGLTIPSSERRFVNLGIGGQTAVQIAARQGGLATTCTVSGGSIPASGSVTLTSVYPDLIYNPTLDGRLNNFPVSINQVAGTLTRVSSTQYTFARSTPGSAVSAAGTVAIVPNTTDAAPIIAVDLFAPAAKTGADLNGYTAIFWLGHNGIGGSNGETMLSLLTGCVQKLINSRGRFLILPRFNATAESGTSPYTSLQNNFWSPLATAFPGNYYDIRRDFIDNAKTWMQAKYPTEYASDWGQAFVPSRASAGSDSDYDITKDMIPRALREDTVHLNTMGSKLFSELLATKLLTLGW